MSDVGYIAYIFFRCRRSPVLIYYLKGLAYHFWSKIVVKDCWQSRSSYCCMNRTGAKRKCKFRRCRCFFTYNFSWSTRGKVSTAFQRYSAVPGHLLPQPASYPRPALPPPCPPPKTLDKKTVNRQEQRGDLFIWIGGPLHKRFQGPVLCCLLPPLNIGMPLAVMAIKQVPIGSQRDQTSLLFYSLYCVGPGKILFVNLSSSIFSTKMDYSTLKQLEQFPKNIISPKLCYGFDNI